MKGFIEVTEIGQVTNIGYESLKRSIGIEEVKILINTMHIIYINGSLIKYTEGSIIKVKESYEEIKELIKKSFD